MDNNLIYIYCLSESQPQCDLPADISDLNVLKVMDFCVYLKPVSEEEFSEENFKKNLSDIKWLETNAREHISVISRIMENAAVIPFKFGTIFFSEERLNKFISSYSDSLVENFRQIKGKEEWSVRIYCDLNALSQEVSHLSEEVSNLENQIKSSLPGKAFLLNRKKTELIQKETERLCNHYGQEYFNEYNRISDSTSLNNLLPEELTGRKEKMILNAACLVRKENVDAFRGKADEIFKKDGTLGFSIEVTGPWPAFSFISLNEKVL